MSIFYNSVWDYKFLAVTPFKTLFQLLPQKGMGNSFQFPYFNIYSSSYLTLGKHVVWRCCCGLMKAFCKLLSISHSAETFSNYLWIKGRQVRVKSEFVCITFNWLPHSGCDGSNGGLSSVLFLLLLYIFGFMSKLYVLKTLFILSKELT